MAPELITRQERVAALSEQQRRLAEPVVSGRGSTEIARHLLVSPQTVEWLVNKLLYKLGVRSRAAAGLRARLRR